MLDIQTDSKLQHLEWCVKQGWPIFPCGDDKRPLVKDGFYAATLDFDVIQQWHEHWPYANWAVRTGTKEERASGFFVIDIDNHEGKVSGYDTWDNLMGEHTQPIETVTVSTGGGGSQLYFKYPADCVIKNKTNAWPSIDVRASGGYVIVPPSVTDKPYTFEISPADVPISDPPAWILEHLTEREQEPTEKNQPQEIDLATAIKALNSLKRERVEDYDMWVRVGMSLYDLGEDGLIAWDNWSKQSEKYKDGECARKWETFTSDYVGANRITFASLIYWANEDGGRPFIRLAPKKAKPSDYITALKAFGYKFELNEMNDAIYVNGNRMTDVIMSTIEYDLRENEYKSEKDTKVSIGKMAYDNRFHPIKDYLDNLKQDGYQDGPQWHGIDHIGHLAEYFEDKDGIFPILLRKWLIGAVRRIYKPGWQNPMLVLDGHQGLGKSRFSAWLGSPLPAFFIQSPINTNDKDFLTLLCSKFVWEVEELGATFRKSDLESLKGFLSKEIVTVRKPYDKDEIDKPATASFIGTINNVGGFLADSTGSRRFRVCTLSKINWAYADNIDVNQVWAQAVALHKHGETNDLGPELQKRMNEINERYEVDDPLEYAFLEYFHVDPEEKHQFTATAKIIERLRLNQMVTGSDQQVSNRLANILSKRGCENSRQRINGHQVRVWSGVWERAVYKNSE